MAPTRAELVARLQADVAETVSDGVALQEEKTWLSFIDRQANDITYGANDGEIYFEEHEIESFFIRLRVFDVELIHDLHEHSWGQRVVRFYDLDGHVIEVGEHMGDVARRFLNAGMTREEAAKRMQVPSDMIEGFLKD